MLLFINLRFSILHNKKNKKTCPRNALLELLSSLSIPKLFITMKNKESQAILIIKFINKIKIDKKYSFKVMKSINLCSRNII